MLYTVKDKSIYPFVLFVIALLTYISHLYYDHMNQGNGWREEFGHAKQVEISKVAPSGLLLGGSNVAYSLSASHLSDLTEYSWYNLGLSSEAFNDDNYWNYVSSTLIAEQRLNIELVVYSPISFVRNGHLSSRANDNSDPWGNRKLSWVPSTALAIRTKNILKEVKPSKYPLPIARGDFDFDKKNCIPNYQEAFEKEMNWKQIQTWLNSQVSSISEIFPNAAVVIVVPSEFYGEAYDIETDRSYNVMLKDLIQSNFGPNVSFLAQPPFAEKRITCDGRHHANSIGRTWRTTNLAEFVNSKVDL